MEIKRNPMKILFEFPYYPVIEILVKIKYQFGFF